MANLRAIHSVGSSLVTYLRNVYPRGLVQPDPQFLLVSSGQLNGEEVNLAPAVTLYLYRVTMNPHVRNAPHVTANHQVTQPLSVDLHYLLTVWADNAEAEHTILGWAIREMYQHQTLSKSDLTAEGGWSAGDLVQLIPSELSTEDLMRIWDALDPGYRLSVSYIARVVRIEPELQPDVLPVVARRIDIRATGVGAGDADESAGGSDA